MGKHSPKSGPVATTGPVSRFSRRDIIWSVALVLSLALGGGGIAVAAAAGDQVMCPPGVSLEVRPDGTWRCLPSVDPSVSPSTEPTTPAPSPTASPTPSPTASPTPSPTPTPSATPPPSPSTPPGSFPTATSVGVPAGWVPKVVRTGWTISTPGVYEDVRVNGNINVRAAGVTLRRVEVVGGIIDNENASRCYNNLVLEDVTVRGVNNSSGAIQPGGYTARRVALLDVTEGFRVGGRSDAGCGPVLIEDSFARVVPPPGCGDWHGDALQGYDAPPLTIRHSTLELWETGGCGGTGAYFYPVGQQPATVDGLLVRGGGYVFRSDSPVSVRGLRVVDGTWAYAPVDKDVTCRRVASWVDNAVSDAAGNPLRPITC